MTTHATLREHAGTLLDGLGTTVDHIAATLRRQRAVGTPNDAMRCVVARYLNAVLCAEPAVKAVGVTHRDLHILVRSRLRRRVIVPLPAPMQEFVTAFDAVRFPELVAALAPLTPPASPSPPVQFPQAAAPR